jgi:hypothetical protein
VNERVASMGRSEFRQYAKDLEHLLETMVQFGIDWDDAMDPWEYYIAVVRKRVLAGKKAKAKAKVKVKKPK